MDTESQYDSIMDSEEDSKINFECMEDLGPER